MQSSALLEVVPSSQVSPHFPLMFLFSLSSGIVCNNFARWSTGVQLVIFFYFLYSDVVWLDRDLRWPGNTFNLSSRRLIS